MKIDQILKSLKKDAPAKPEEKTASAQPAPAAAPAAAPAQALAVAVAAAAPAAEKTAAVAASPAGDLAKMASEILGAEKEAAVAEAKLLANAFADTLLARLEPWSKEARAVLHEVGAAPAATATFDPSLLKQAAELGYQQARAELEKVAADEYDRGWNETVEAIYQTAGNEFLKAAAVTDQLIAAARAA